MRRPVTGMRTSEALSPPLVLSLSKDAWPRWRSMVAFYAYLLHCADGRYYAGHTDALEQRLAEHQAGQGGDFTARRRPVTLVWSETFATRDEAFACERRVNGWSRAKKQALVAGDWERLRDLARNRRDRPDRRHTTSFDKLRTSGSVAPAEPPTLTQPSPASGRG